ncbi:hypothetical protein F2P81_023184 [Scophthalmus maximus]|uniref:Uncharacterized protein n=1 Tax=Scophthalmus maximus TaxID=52904 RepID=A0A6A4RZ01_SCOMX|nr:hypothetical protein F2P81_023184 [Scophthalmus maximus]
MSEAEHSRGGPTAIRRGVTRWRTPQPPTEAGSHTRSPPPARRNIFLLLEMQSMSHRCRLLAIAQLKMKTDAAVASGSSYSLAPFKKLKCIHQREQPVQPEDDDDDDDGEDVVSSASPSRISSRWFSTLNTRPRHVSPLHPKTPLQDESGAAHPVRAVFPLHGFEVSRAEIRPRRRGHRNTGSPSHEANALFVRPEKYSTYMICQGGNEQQISPLVVLFAREKRKDVAGTCRRFHFCFVFGGEICSRCDA